MSSFSVVWSDDALNELASLWMSVADPADVNSAQTRIDSLLSRDPLGLGVEVAEGLREHSVPPLRVFYSVDSDQNIVEVASVKQSRPKP